MNDHQGESSRGIALALVALFCVQAVLNYIQAYLLSAAGEQAVAGLRLCTRLEGILPALEPSHALSFAGTLEGRVLVCLSGRGDKDMDNLAPD